MSTLSVATIKSQNTLPPAVQNTSGTEIGTFCRAWVNFNGTGTVAIRASFNVSSITDNGTGDYTVNFTTAMSDANFGWSVSTSSTGYGMTTGALTASSIRISTVSSAGAATDFPYISVPIFR